MIGLLRKTLPLLAILFLVSSISVQAQIQSTIWGIGEGGKVTYLSVSKVSITSPSIPFPISFENRTSIEIEFIELADDGYRYLQTIDDNTTEQLVTIQRFDTENATVFIPNGGVPYLLPLAYQEIDDFLPAFGESWEYIGQLAFLFGNETIITANHTLSTSLLTLRLGLYLPNATGLDTADILPFSEGFSIQDFNASSIDFNLVMDYEVETGLLSDNQATGALNGTMLFDQGGSSEIINATLTFTQKAELQNLDDPGKVAERNALSFDAWFSIGGLALLGIIVFRLTKKERK